MKNLKKLFAVIGLAAMSSLFIGNAAFAAFFDSAENYVLGNLLQDDAYIAAANANIEENIEGDLYLAGGNITINGDVTEDLVVAGGWVNIFGNVGDDVRVLGGNVAIYGNIEGDLIVGGGKVDLTKSSTVKGSLITGSGILTVDGSVQEDIRGAAGMLILNGVVAGDVVITIEERIDFGENASIEGDLQYSALLEIGIPEGVVKGEVHFNKFEKEETLNQVTFAYMIYKAIAFGAGLLLLLVFVLLAPRFVVEGAKLTKDNVLRSFGIGLLGLIVAIVGSIILMITVIGIPLALIVWASLVIILYVTKVFVAAWLANYIVDLSKIKKFLRLKLFFLLAAAMLVYYLVGLIPYVGWIIDLVLFMIGIGTLFLTEFKYLKFLKEKKML